MAELDINVKEAIRSAIADDGRYGEEEGVAIVALNRLAPNPASLEQLKDAMVRAGDEHHRLSIWEGRDKVGLVLQTPQLKCKLPGEVRKLGGSVHLTAGRVVTTTRSECIIRGGSVEGE